jgi:hypothetical protein
MRACGQNERDGKLLVPSAVTARRGSDKFACAVDLVG